MLLCKAEMLWKFENVRAFQPRRTVRQEDIAEASSEPDELNAIALSLLYFCIDTLVMFNKAFWDIIKVCYICIF